MNEGFLESHPDLIIFETISLQELGYEVFLNILSNLVASVPIEHCEKTQVRISVKGKGSYFGILHIPPPTLHLAGSEFEFVVFI